MNESKEGLTQLESYLARLLKAPGMPLENITMVLCLTEGNEEAQAELMDWPAENYEQGLTEGQILLAAHQAIH